MECNFIEFTYVLKRASKKYKSLENAGFAYFDPNRREYKLIIRGKPSTHFYFLRTIKTIGSQQYYLLEKSIRNAQNTYFERRVVGEGHYSSLTNGVIHIILRNRKRIERFILQPQYNGEFKNAA